MELKIGKLKIITLILLIFLLLSSCALGKPEASTDTNPEQTSPVLIGEPMLISIHSRFVDSNVFKSYADQYIDMEWFDGWIDKSFAYDCFLDRQLTLPTLNQAVTFWLQDAQEVGYALYEPIIGAPELTKEERLELERQIQVYAKEQGNKYCYLCSQGFVVFAFTKEQPERFVRAALRAYNRSPEFGRDIEETEVKLQHQVLIEHTLLDMFDWKSDIS